MHAQRSRHTKERCQSRAFKTITVKEAVFNKYYYFHYKKREGELKAKGISFSGFVTGLMREAMIKHETFLKYAPFIETIAIEDDRVILKDNKRNRIAEVMIKDGKLQCLLEDNGEDNEEGKNMTDCVHIGFVYSLPEIYEMLDKKGVQIKRRR